MYRGFVCCVALVILPAAALAGAPATSPEAGSAGEKLLSGMSIVGNDDAPKSLVIVPWKSSDPGDTLDVLRALDAGRQPVDPDVFLRELTYYEIRARRSVHPNAVPH